MSNTYLTAPETALYCPPCADVFGTIDGAGKRCRCSNSAGIEPLHGDLDSGFEICRYCQAELTKSGSRWSTFYCDYCRPMVRAVNTLLDKRGLVSLPIGRHSLMHTAWRHARPFTATPVVEKWSAERLRSGWRAYGGGLAPVAWAAFGEFERELREQEYPHAIHRVSMLVQRTKPDFIFGELSAANAELLLRRAGKPKSRRRRRGS